MAARSTQLWWCIQAQRLHVQLLLTEGGALPAVVKYGLVRVFQTLVVSAPGCGLSDGGLTV
jgi:hypothetical protein